MTGATHGIGRAVTERFMSDGALVAAFALDDANADALEAELPSEHVAVFRGDVAREDDVNGLVDAVLDRWGSVDVLCNLAAIRPVGDVVETPPHEWDRVFEVNVRGTYLTCRAVIPAMRRSGGGVILNFGSPSGHGGEGHVAYCATKGAVASLTLSLAMDHVRNGIRVNLLVPGSTQTGMNLGRDPAIDQAIADRWSVTGRLNQPAEIASVVAFLASDGAVNVSGAVFHIGVLAGEPVRRIAP